MPDSNKVVSLLKFGTAFFIWHNSVKHIIFAIKKNHEIHFNPDHNNITFVLKRRTM